MFEVFLSLISVELISFLPNYHMITCSWLQTIHKDRYFWKKPLWKQRNGLQKLGDKYMYKLRLIMARIQNVFCIHFGPNVHVKSVSLAVEEWSVQERTTYVRKNKMNCRELSTLPERISTTPITAMGCQQCLPLSVVQLKGKHCRKPHCRRYIRARCHCCKFLLFMGVIFDSD